MGLPRIADHFDSYEAYVIDLEARNVCAMETHYPARITFAWACGEPVSVKPTPCASEGCSVRMREEAAAPLASLSPHQVHAAIAEIQARIGAAFTWKKSE